MALLEYLSSSGLSIAVILIIVLFIGAAAIGATVLIMKWRRYQQFHIEIWQKDGFGHLTIKYDQGGVFVDDKTGNKRLFLKKANVGLDPDNIPYLVTPTGKKKVMLLQTGLKNFRYIKPMVRDDLLYFTVGEEDVNWAINSYERQKKLFAQSWIAQYLPFIMLAFVSMIILIMFIQLFNKFPVILEIVKELKEVALHLAQAKSGTTIIT